MILRQRAILISRCRLRIEAYEFDVNFSEIEAVGA